MIPAGSNLVSHGCHTCRRWRIKKQTWRYY